MSGTGEEKVEDVYVFANDGPVVAEEQDIIDLLGETWGQEVAIAALPASRLPNPFFSLPTGFAGMLTQKFANHRMPLAIIGDVTRRAGESAAFDRFVREANEGRQLWFVPDLDALRERLNAQN